VSIYNFVALFYNPIYYIQPAKYLSLTDQMAVFLHRRDLCCNQQLRLALVVTLVVLC